MSLDPSVLARLRDRAHIHTDECYGERQLGCGEHHLHDDNCYGRWRFCNKREDHDLVLLFVQLDVRGIKL